MITLKIAFRNILLHKVKTLVIGLIIVFGTVLAIVGNAFVDAVSGGMRKSLTHSVTGDIQIYSSEAKDKLSVFGDMGGSMPDIGHVNDFRKVRETLLAKVPNVRAVIPMGTSFALLNPGNLLDMKLEELRALYQAKPRAAARITALKEHLQAIVHDIGLQMEERKGGKELLSTEDKLISEAPRNLARAQNPRFWADFDARFEERIEFLANTMAPLIFDDSMLYLSYIGTVPGSFKNAFPLFEIVKGTEIPQGKRGFLFADYVYETTVKHRVARSLDAVKRKIEKDRLTIASSKELQDKIYSNVASAAEIYTQLDPRRARELVPRLQKLLGSSNAKAGSTDIRELLQEYLKMTDGNFRERYRFFYDEIAPHIILYKVKIGDVFPITAISRSGYSTSVNMKVYGTYRFKSFESSPLAGSFNVMDMISFRELFGFMTAEKRAEVQELEKEMGLADVARDDVEAMFGKPQAPAENTETPKLLDAAKKTEVSRGFAERRKIFDVQYSDGQMENGIFLSAAILLKDESRVGQTIAEIRRVAEAEKLGIQAVDWSEAAGIVGQLALMVRGILYFLVLVIFGVATFVIMNSMLMATLERSREIGTMRAIGAQRRFILSLFLQETAILSFIFGLIGTVVGVGIILWIGRMGIPAGNDVATFFFSGDRLYLSVNFVHIAIVFACMTLVAVISTQYPAWRAMRISPLEAMQKSD